MQTVTGVLLDVSLSTQKYAVGKKPDEDVDWARSIFEVLNNFIKSDVLFNNHIFAIGVGGRHRRSIFDVFKTIKNLLNRNDTTIPSEYVAIVYNIFELVEKTGAKNIQKWAPFKVIKESLSHDNAVFLLKTLQSNEELLKEFVNECLPDACKDVKGTGTITYVKQALKNVFTSAITQVVTADREKILDVVENAKCLLLRDVVSVLSVQEASIILNGCNLTYKLNTEGMMEQLSKSVEPYIYGKTPLFEALHKATHIFSKSEYKNYKKVLFVLSAGEPTDKGDITSILKTLKDMDVIVVSCLLSRGRIQPQKLFSVEKNEWNKGAKFLFQLSSTIASQLLPRTIFIKQGWDIETINNETKLFLQVNHPDNIKNVIDFARDVVCCQDSLSDLMASVSLDIYINQSTGRFSAPNQTGGTCYANASAAVLHLAMKRIIGRDEGYPQFEDLRQEMIKEYGNDGANITRVLKQMTEKYHLHYDIVQVEDAMEAIVSKRPVVATFRLTENEWKLFKKHFTPPDKKKSEDKIASEHKNASENENASERKNDFDILTKAVIDINKQDTTAITEGHAVVLTSFNSKCFRFMNSWGEKWGEKGFFRVENAEVLNFTFFDVYWTENDLSSKEKAAYKIEGPKVAKKLMQQLTCLKTETYKCPKCPEKSLVSLFTGSLSKAKCPNCGAYFNCNGAGNILALNMYLTSLAK